MIDLAALSGHDRVVVVRAHQRMVSHHQARLVRAMAAVAESMGELFEDDPALATVAAPAEIRAALTVTRRAADADLDLAVGVVERLSRVGELLGAGEIDLRRARVLVEGTLHLGAGTARAVVERLSDHAHPPDHRSTGRAPAPAVHRHRS